MLSFRQQNILVWVTKKQSCYKKTFKDSVFFSCNSDMWYFLSFKILLFLLVSPPIYLFKSLATTKELILFLFLMFPSKKTKEDFQRCHIQLQSCINSSQREDFSAKNLLCALIKSQYFAFPPLGLFILLAILWKKWGGIPLDTLMCIPSSSRFNFLGFSPFHPL